MMKQITFIGTGYVGLVSGAGISDFGHKVVCADIDDKKIDALQNGEIPIYEPGLKEIVDRNVNAGRLSFTSDVDGAIQAAEVIFIAVGTPQSDNGEADLSAVKAVAKTIGRNLNGYKIVCTKSTVPIGTGEMVRSIIDGENTTENQFDYVSNPEFLREGSAVKDFLWPDRVVIGTETEKAFDILKDVYRPLYINETPMIYTNVKTAEMIKYASNAFLALKISYINEIANLCEAVDADVHIVAKTMGIDGRISPKFLHPGPGYGGSCFPKDTHALATIAEKEGSPLKTIEAAIVTNDSQKVRMVNKLRTLTGGFKGKTIAVLGLAFKPQTDDVRESASVTMLEFLTEEGANVNAYDPIAAENMKQKFPNVTYVPSWEEAVSNADGMVIMTEWNEFRGLNLDTLKSLMKTPTVLDTRNILSPTALKKAGFMFDNVGRPNGSKTL